MKVFGTYFQNDREKPLVYGEIEIINPKRKRLRGEEAKEGILAESVMVGFCGTDRELMNMGRELRLGEKFPQGTNRLINGHEGIVYIPSENRYAIVLIRGGDSYDPTRYTEEESYFEYGCDGADGLFSDRNYYHPDMLLPIPDAYVKDGKIALSFAKKMVFPDPYACMIFQRERMEDLGEAQNFRVEKARLGCSEEEARTSAREQIFSRVLIFGLGTTGMFMGELIRERYPNSHIVFVGKSEKESAKVRFACQMSGVDYIQSREQSKKELADEMIKALGGKATLFIGSSGSNVEHELAFTEGVLGCNGIYNSFSLGPQLKIDTMPFGFKNHLIFGSINFRQDHMEEAIVRLAESRYDEIVELIDKEEFIKDPMKAYEEKIYSKGAPLKTAVIWNSKYIDMEAQGE